MSGKPAAFQSCENNVTQSTKGRSTCKGIGKVSALDTAKAACCLFLDDSDEEYHYQPAGVTFSDVSSSSRDIDVEIGLIEDHFSCPEGYFGFSTSEELEMAIENCKEIIMQTPENTEKKKQLIKKLVQLRLKLQETKEGLNKLPDSKVVLGHSFELRSLERPQQYCEKCCRVIWGVLHGWYCCKSCGFKCHSKCLNLITRVCASTKVSENPSYILDICPEVGLSQQKYRCAECRRKIIFKDNYCLPRQCDYNGLYYCSFCHWNSQAIIPSRVIHNWDFTPRKVSRASLQFLRLMMRKPILNIELLNSSLFGFVTELSIVKKLREDILVMKQYFLTCHAALEGKLLLYLQDRQHFVENANTYSLQDLIDTVSGQLINYLQGIHSTFIRHITKECQGCRGKGFICELCKADEVLFPFDSQTNTCSLCYSVFHQDCYLRWEGHCPKCARRAKANINK